MGDILNCEGCVFYCPGDEDTGTCAVSENIVEPFQEACNNHVSKCDEWDR